MNFAIFLKTYRNATFESETVLFHFKGEKERYQSKDKSKDISYRIINLKSTIMKRGMTDIQKLQCELIKVDE